MAHGIARHHEINYDVWSDSDSKMSSNVVLAAGMEIFYLSDSWRLLTIGRLVPEETFSPSGRCSSAALSTPTHWVDLLFLAICTLALLVRLDEATWMVTSPNFLVHLAFKENQATAATFRPKAGEDLLKLYLTFQKGHTV